MRWKKPGIKYRPDLILGFANVFESKSTKNNQKNIVVNQETTGNCFLIFFLFF